MIKKIISFLFALAFLSIGFFIAIQYMNLNKTIVFAEEKSSTIRAFQDSFREVSKKILPSTVEVHATGIVKQELPMIPFFFFDIPGDGFNTERKTNWAGSGVIIGRDSKKSTLFYVLTNNHLVKGANEFEIVVYDKKNYKAKLIDKDPKKDLALLSFESNNSNIKPAELGNSDELEIGDWVMAVGSPFQFSFTVTAGIVSGLKRRSVDPGSSSRNLFIQTDAAINRGNSGGPLVNIKGEVVGINAWIASTSGGSIGLGFAIPINNAKKTIDSFLKGKKFKSGWIGISFYPYERDIEILKSLGQQDDNHQVSSAIIASLYSNSPAFKVGLRPGDIITKINNIEMKNHQDVVYYVNGFYAEEKISINILRDREEKLLEVKLEKRPDEKEIENIKLIPGFTVYPLTDNIKFQLGLRNWIRGVVVDKIFDKGLENKIKIKSGDIIISVNSKSVNSLREFYDALLLGKINTYKVLRGNSSKIVSF